MSDSNDSQRLQDALAERDEALRKAAAARAELEALKLALRQAGQPAPPDYPPTANPADPPPRRYVLVDRVNDLARHWLGPLHRVLRPRR